MFPENVKRVAELASLLRPSLVIRSWNIILWYQEIKEERMGGDSCLNVLEISLQRQKFEELSSDYLA